MTCRKILRVNAALPDDGASEDRNASEYLLKNVTFCVIGGELNVSLTNTDRYERRYRTLCVTVRCSYCIFNFDPNWNTLQDFRVICTA